MRAVDMRPFYIVKGTGFKNYTQTVLNIGVNSKVGMLVDNILPDPTTISKNVRMRSNAGREILIAALKSHLAEGIWIGDTTDISTDDINKVKALVTYVKQANLQDEIAKTLKQENATRWNPAPLCMINVDEGLPELTETLRARGRGLVSKVVAADITTKEKDGTITTLKKDSPAFIALKPKFAELIREKFIWSDIHVIAALLNRKTKCSLDKFGIDSADIELGQKNLGNMMKDHMIGFGIGKRSVRSHRKQKEDN
ncbi:hypothetical protein AXG93_2646s1150 [Marchantia polymorpha subsp. ruderalis]|uniref:Hermes trasposase DNA-binding domain-containing protein n=1 Tax=Marchantia polymorpha subsp. ruderalis TaxID=1480154 RepID=A0A176W5V6_MARPO|nr:hypothetical protein AXG93_2646s1150 [Marchantia polymorpha subsp. ruderalis]